MKATYPHPATVNNLTRQPLVVRPIGNSGLNGTSVPQYKSAPHIRNNLTRQPPVQR